MSTTRTESQSNKTGRRDSSQAKPPRDHRALGLDILRFVAVSLVVFRHMQIFDCPPDAGRPGVLFHGMVYTLNRGGWVGVDIFFVLSGFLVSGLLFREWRQRQEVFIGRFLLRRGLKIYPSFWFFLISMLVLSAIRHEPVNTRDLVGEIFFLQNLWGNLFTHTWSLAVEEHFYLLCAAGTWLLLRMQRNAGQNPFKSIPLLFVLVASFCLVTRLVSNMVYVTPPIRVRHLLFGTHIRIDSLFFGVFLSYFWHFYFTAKHHRLIHQYRWVFVLVGIGLFTPMFFGDLVDLRQTWMRVYGFVLCYLAGGALLFGFLKIFEGAKSRLARFLGFLGANSYSVYLWHFVGIDFAGSLFTQRTHEAGAWLGYCLLSNGVAWGIGIIAARVVEFPMLKLRDRWFPSRITRPLKG